MRRPLLLTSPWLRACIALRHRPGMVLASLATGAVVGLVAAAPVLFVSAVGAGAVQVQYADTCPASTAVTMMVPPTVRVNGTYQRFDDTAALELLTDEADGDAALRALEQWSGPGLLVVVTHQVNITGLTGLVPASGESIAVRRRAGALEVLRRLPAPDA